MNLQLLLGLVLSGLLEIIKLLSKQFGVEMSKKIVYGTLFLGVFVFTYLTSAGIISKELITNFLAILSSAVATYQLIIKPVTR